MHDILSQKRLNTRKSVLMMAGFFALVLAVGLAIDVYRSGSITGMGLPVATLVSLAVAVVQAWAAWYRGAKLVVKSVGGEGPKKDDPSHRRLHNVVTEMALASGLPMPGVFVVPDPAPNAFAAGRGPESSVVAVTQGLLDTMSRDELQAVVAHEMGHIKNRDVLTMTVAAVLVGTVALLTDWAVRTWRYGGVRVRKGKGVHPLALLVIGLFILLSPVMSRALAMAVSRTREYLADSSAAEFTRNPLALATALEKIRDDVSPVRRAHRGTAHLFISDPLKRKTDEREGMFSNLFSTHPPVNKRIERLRKMAYAWNKYGGAA